MRPFLAAVVLNCPREIESERDGEGESESQSERKRDIARRESME